MLLVSLAFVAAPVWVGSYSLPELCRVLRTSTDVEHSVNQGLLDYPVFVSVKSGDAKRVRQLVAAALHAHWMKDGKAFRLMPDKPEPKEGLEEFTRKFKKAAQGTAAQFIPPQEIYDMAPGETRRFSKEPSSPFVRPLAKTTPSKFADVKIRRFGPNVFELPQFSDVELKSVPEEVEKSLGDDLKKVAFTAEDLEKLRKYTHDPEAMRVQWKDVSRVDPVAVLNEEPLKGVAGQISEDFALALPDLSLFALLESSGGDGTVAAILRNYAMVVDWEVVDGAVVGRLPVCERVKPCQSRRNVLAKMISALGTNGVLSTEILSYFVANQRRYASDSWCDAMMLALVGMVIDQENIGDYPFNIRLYTALSGADWDLLRTQRAFPISQLSRLVQLALRDLLLQARTRMDPDHTDPAFWPTLLPSQLLITASLVEEPVLISYVGYGASVDKLEHAAVNYDLRKKELGREPTYRPATTRRLKLKISCNMNGESVDTGFSEVAPVPGSRASVWQELPSELAKQFSEHLVRSGGG